MRSIVPPRHEDLSERGDRSKAFPAAYFERNGGCDTRYGNRDWHKFLPHGEKTSSSVFRWRTLYKREAEIRAAAATNARRARLFTDAYRLVDVDVAITSTTLQVGGPQRHKLARETSREEFI